ncbi:hypothetical protein CK203_116473 [Vitis vinifera]|uniref:Uncharacterized protein n=1 Tax=Vitis vinifera TaxID=29760 RepID=A0A438BNY8_VITVI|nr:hypothetical protein CK203_116473 [Vitis vinifera]
MPDIERYSGIGCPKIHLRLYNTLMRAHGMDDAQLVALFPMSLSGAAQSSLSVPILMYLDESWRPPGRGQMSHFFICHSLEDKGWLDLKSLSAAFSVEEAIARGLWTDATASPDSKGKKPIGSFSRSGEVDAISYQHRRPAYHSPYRLPPVRAHFPYPQYKYQPDYVQEPYIAQDRHAATTTTFEIATHPPSRPYAQRPVRQVYSIGMTLTRAFEKLKRCGIDCSFGATPLPHPIPPHFRSHGHCLYHQIQGHDTERCSALHHAIQDLIDSGLVDLAGPSVTTTLCLHILHMQFLLLLVFSILICILRVLMAWYFGTSRVEGWD